MSEAACDTFSSVVSALFSGGSPAARFRDEWVSSDGTVRETWTVEPGVYKVGCAYELGLLGVRTEYLEFAVKVDWQPCTLGGVRPYLYCPRCWRRVTSLWADAPELVCRGCAGVRYPSKSLLTHERKLQRAQEIRQRLGGSMTALSEFGPRPRGMHRRTYARLIAEAEELENEGIVEVLKRVPPPGRRVRSRRRDDPPVNAREERVWARLDYDKYALELLADAFERQVAARRDNLTELSPPDNLS